MHHTAESSRIPEFPMTRQPLLWKNGEASETAYPDERVTFERAFNYGDGFFSTARVIEGQVQFWEQHQVRNRHGLRALRLTLPDETLSQWIINAAHALQNGRVKWLVSRGLGEPGYVPPRQPARVDLMGWPEVKIHQALHAIRLSAGIHTGHLTQVLGLPMPALVGLKTLNRLEQVLLSQELADRRLSEALVTDLNGIVVEGVSSNCFFKRHGQWQTPDLSQAGIHGVMRAEILTRCAQHGILCEPVRLTLKQFSEGLEALFFCNSLKGMQPVNQYNDTILDFKAVQHLHSLLC